MIFILSGHTHDDDDEPHVTEEVFFYCVRGQGVPFCFIVDCLIKELKKNEVLDESSFKIMASLEPPREVIDRLHYVMYRIGRKENGLQIF